MIDRPHPEALPHGKLREIFPDVFMITGSMKMQGRPITFSRNMIVVRENGVLTLFNTVRLDELGLQQLDELGEVKNVVRLAGYHGSDDPFYKERYSATVYAIKGQPYVSGFDLKAEPYLEADEWLTHGDDLPVTGARLHVLPSCKPPEAVVVLLRHGGTLISGDALQNWGSADIFFSWFAKVMMRFGGFIKPTQVGPGWLKFARPSSQDLRSLLELRFDNVLPAHGDPVIGGAYDAYRPSIERAASAREQGK